MKSLNRRQFGQGIIATGVAASALSAPGIVRAQSFPSRAINYIIPFNPGGESDVTARFQQPFFEQITGQSVVIQSKPGAGGATAWAQLNGFEPDGHTIMNTIVPHTVLQPAMKDVGYQTADINNVFFFHYTPDAVVVKADSPYQTLQDLIDQFEAMPSPILLHRHAGLVFEGLSQAAQTERGFCSYGGQRLGRV